MKLKIHENLRAAISKPKLNQFLLKKEFGWFLLIIFLMPKLALFLNLS